MRKTALFLFFLSLFCFSAARVSEALRNQQALRSVAKTAIVNVPSSGVFAKSSMKSEQVSEVLLGDEFIVTKQAGDWAYGYIPSQKD